MRFAIAVSILAHSLPVASKTKDSANAVFPIDNERANNMRQRLLLDEETSRIGGSLAENVIRELKQARTKNKVANRRGTLRNLMTAMDECDPATYEADVGVLSCGEGRYCEASDNSDLGGICVDDPVKLDHRMEDIQDEYVAAYFSLCEAQPVEILVSYMDYNCDWVDVETKTGILVLKDTGGYYGSSDCDFGFMFARDAHANDFVGVCFSVSSYEKSLCFGYELVYDNVIGSNCTIAVDGTPCNSCYFVTDSSGETTTKSCSGPFDIYAFQGERFVFDCNNVGLGTGDYSCSEDIEATGYILSSCSKTFFGDDFNETVETRENDIYVE